MTVLALGTVQLGGGYGVSNLKGQPSLNEAHEIIELARKCEIKRLDTAIAYGDSEDILGQIGVSDFHVTTKVPSLKGTITDYQEHLVEMVERSLDRLKIKKIGTLLFHDASDLMGSDGPLIYRAALDLRDSGVVGAVGVSVGGVEELNLLGGRYLFESVQVPLSLFDRTLIDSGWLERLRALGSEVHVRSIFLQGLLLMNNENRPTYFDKWRSLFVEYEDWLSATNVDAKTACMHFANNIQGLTSVVVGVNSARELADLVELHEGAPMLDELCPSSTDLDLIRPSRWRL